MNLSPQLIHIVVELVVIAGLAFWMNFRVNGLKKQVDEYKERIDRYEKALSEHATALRAMSSLLERHEMILTGGRPPQMRVEPPRMNSTSVYTPPEVKSPPSLDDKMDELLASELNDIERSRSTPQTRDETPELVFVGEALQPPSDVPQKRKKKKLTETSSALMPAFLEMVEHASSKNSSSHSEATSLQD